MAFVSHCDYGRICFCRFLCLQCSSKKELSRSKMNSRNHARSLYLVKQMNFDVVRSSKYAATVSKQEPGGPGHGPSTFPGSRFKGHFQPQIGWEYSRYFRIVQVSSFRFKCSWLHLSPQLQNTAAQLWSAPEITEVSRAQRTSESPWPAGLRPVALQKRDSFAPWAAKAVQMNRHGAQTEGWKGWDSTG